MYRRCSLLGLCVFGIPLMVWGSLFGGAGGCGDSSTVSSEPTADPLGNSQPTDGETTPISVSICASMAGDYVCTDGCTEGIPSATIADVSSPILTMGSVSGSMVGSCPDFTADLVSPTQAGETSASITFTSADAFTFVATNGDITRTAQFERDTGQSPSIDGALLAGTFVPAADNTFNASVSNSNVVIAEACSPTCSFTYAPQFYSNCVGTLAGSQLSMTCDVLGTLRPTVTVDGSTVTLRQDNITMLDSDGNVTGTEVFSYIKQ